MNKIIGLLLAAFLFAAPVFGDGPVITPSWKATWDFDDTGVTLTEFRVYMSATPGIVPDGTSFVAVVPNTDREWVIVSSLGQQYMVVTALLSAGETAPSNEAAFVMSSAPLNLQIVPVGD